MNVTDQQPLRALIRNQNFWNECNKPSGKAGPALIERYGDAEMFLKTFSPDIQLEVARNQRQAYLGHAPALHLVCESYGREIALCWLEIALENLSDFCGVREKPSMQQTAELILEEYPYLKVTEIALFLYRFKCGRYGEFFGVVDPLRIMCSLRKFTEERQVEILDYIREKEQKEKHLPARPDEQPVSYREYLEWKKEKEKNGPACTSGISPGTENPEQTNPDCRTPDNGIT